MAQNCTLTTKRKESRNGKRTHQVGHDGSGHADGDGRRQPRRAAGLRGSAEEQRGNRSRRVQRRLRENPRSRHARHLRASDLGSLQGRLWRASRQDDRGAPRPSSRPARRREYADAEPRHRQSRCRHRPRRRRGSGQEPSSQLQPRGRRRVTNASSTFNYRAPSGLTILLGLYL